MPDRKTLAIIGAGPKGIAVAVKAKVLEEFGLRVDRVVLIEKNGVGANWSGNFGYTNGEMKLGTSPEKDVVFPIETDVGDAQLNKRIRQRLMHFTWASFLVHTHRYSDWVDRGRPAPCHQLWANYLSWVASQLAPQVEIINAEVIAVDINNGRWELNLRGERNTLVAERLMLTGPGKTRMDFKVEKNMPGVYDLQSFWSAIKGGSFPKAGKMALIGAGENAAAALLALGEHAPAAKIEVITPKGFISTRAENFYENQMYSQPERNHWSEMELADRADFIARTDLGVFSAHAMSILNDQIRHQIIPGRAVGVLHDGRQLVLQLEYAKQLRSERYDQVIFATGFDHVSLLNEILTPRARQTLERVTGPINQQDLSRKIQKDLSVQGIVPALHVPMLAGLMQGPGFANLSCLGRMADRMMLNLRAAAPFAQVAL